MTTTQSLRISAAACFAAIMFMAAAEAQPPRGGGDEGAGRQRGGGQRGGQGGPGGQRGGPGGQRGGQGGQRGGGQQRGGFGGQRGGTPSISKALLLANEDVKDELKIDDGQSATLDAAIEAYREERNEAPRPDFNAIREMPEEERTALFDKMRKEGEALAKKTDETLDALLEPEQVTRLNQIVFQLKSGNLLEMLKSDEPVKKALGVTEDQVAKLDEAAKAAEEAQQKMRDEMQDSFRGGGERPDFTAIRTKMETLRKQNDERVMAVLTDDQKKKIEDMKGEKFDLDPRVLSRGGRGGQGGPGGAQGGRGGQRGGGGRGGDGGGRGGDGGGGGGRQRPPADGDPVI